MIDLSTIDARRSIAAKYAAKYSLDTSLICAVVEQESAWQPSAVRYEPAFYTRYILPSFTNDGTEGRCRAFSYGLMQVMGQVAREMGFNEPYLTALCDPDVGLDWGCRKLKKCLDDCQGDTARALLRYNGGSNALYPKQVANRLAHYQ